MGPKRQYGKPRSEKMLLAIKRVIEGGEVRYAVAREMGVTPSYLYSAVKIERARANLGQVREPSTLPAPD